MTPLANSDPSGSEDDQKVGEFTESEYWTAEYQAERSTDVTQQSQDCVRLFRLDVRVLQLREKYLHSNKSVTILSVINTGKMMIIVWVVGSNGQLPDNS